MLTDHFGNVELTIDMSYGMMGDIECVDLLGWTQCYDEALDPAEAVENTER